ncbi:uncharacterized protein B0H18DRAFT_1117560 [Fomitopsis serialis]|uniref:uncharacterized protein n=1 Tax=Fomitopsis serialis TaxID=139415 RepID=UPI00200756A8|nr:uncharacterized protein B0H18DRAFT_1117560 [Neoantrodia serialis]KAH9929212.1 hypothetical protein B0H18DRAFT_1117560 [Neoantrodia serialis]
MDRIPTNFDMFRENLFVDLHGATYSYYSPEVLPPAGNALQQHPSMATSLSASTFPILDPCDRRRALEQFTDIVCSSTALPPQADRILHDVHTFMLAHPSTSLFTTGENSLSMFPSGEDNLTRAHVGHINPNVHEQELACDGKACRFDSCREILWDTTTAGITKHLLDHHFMDDRTEWENSDERIRCLWRDCRHRGTLKKRSVAKHIGTSHLKTTEVRCDVPGCDTVLSRGDGWKRHVKTVHGMATSP